MTVEVGFKEAYFQPGRGRLLYSLSFPGVLSHQPLAARFHNRYLGLLESHPLSKKKPRLDLAMLFVC